MSNASVYKAVLLDHFHNPRNKGELEAMGMVRRGSNPRCGDEIEVGIDCHNGSLGAVRFRGRGCSICLASASMMTECIGGRQIAQARQLVNGFQQWFDNSDDAAPPHENLAAFSAIRQHPARKKCVLLAWQALAETLDELEQRNRE